MSVNQSNAAMLRALSYAIYYEATTALELVETYEEVGDAHASQSCLIAANVLSRLGTACLSAATALQNDDDALAKRGERQPGDVRYNPKGKSRRMAEEVGSG